MNLVAMIGQSRPPARSNRRVLPRFPSGARAAERLRRYGPNNVPPGDSNLGKRGRDVLDCAGLAWAIPHTFRRTVATLFSEAGVPVGVIADQLGHADASMTMSFYLGRDPLPARPIRPLLGV